MPPPVDRSVGRSVGRSTAADAATPAAATPAAAANPAAVITFYSEQVRRIQRFVASAAAAAAAVKSSQSRALPPGVHSVDSFQGSEAGRGLHSSTS